MPLNLRLIKYGSLNPRQKENYNYQKLSALLADYGFVTIRLSDDWNGADLIAQHINGNTFLKIQLKSRLTFCEKYIGKGIYVAFRRGRDWYLYPHDEMLEKGERVVKFKHTLSWTIDRGKIVRAAVGSTGLEGYKGTLKVAQAKKGGTSKAETKPKTTAKR